MGTTVYAKDNVKVADELFLIVALLHRERPDADSFSIAEILERAQKEQLGEHRPHQNSLKAHAYEHAAANWPPGNGKYRMVFRTQEKRIRLLQPGDYVHPDRNGKYWPEPADVPERYLELIEWAKQRYQKMDPPKTRWLEGLYQMRGLGKESLRGIDPDEYVRSLREGWD